MAGKMAAGTQPAEQNHCRRTHSLLNKALQATQPADSPPGSGLKTHGPPLAGFAAKTQLPTMMADRRAGKWGECEGVGTQEGGCRPT